MWKQKNKSKEKESKARYSQRVRERCSRKVKYKGGIILQWWYVDWYMHTYMYMHDSSMITYISYFFLSNLTMVRNFRIRHVDPCTHPISVYGCTFSWIVNAFCFTLLSFFLLYPSLSLCACISNIYIGYRYTQLHTHVNRTSLHTHICICIDLIITYYSYN